jgi:hypothetical protein
MRKLLVSTLVSLLWAGPCVAQGTQIMSPVPPDLESPSSDPDQDQKETQGTRSVEDALRTQLARAGFTDIEMKPASFLVHAKDANGNPVTLLLSPGSLAERGQVPGEGRNDASDAGTVPTEQKF